MNWSIALPILGSAFVGLCAWLIRVLFFDAITQLRAADQRQGERFGKELEDVRTWQAKHDAVDAERRRRRNDTKGVPVSEDP